jgi:hypothetical protein
VSRRRRPVLPILIVAVCVAMGAASTSGASAASAATSSLGEMKGPECRRLLANGSVPVPARYSLLGVQFTRPTGRAWGSADRSSCRGANVLLRRADLDGGARTVVAVAEFSAPVPSAAGAPTHTDALAATVENVRTTQKLRGQPYANFASTPVTIDGTECARYERSGTDTHVPGEGSKPFTLVAHGVVCLYPGDPLSAVLQVEWSERFPKSGSPSPAVARETAPWLAGLRFGHPGTELNFEDFQDANALLPDNTTSDWSARRTGGAYVLTLRTPGMPGGGTMKVEPARPAVAVQLTMRSTKTADAAWHGPACLAPGRSGGYVFTVDKGTKEWRIAEINPADSTVVEHAVGTSSRISGPQQADKLAIECTADASGATTVRGVVNGKPVGLHVFDPGIGSVGSVGFLAQAANTKTPARVTVDDLLVSVPVERAPGAPSSSQSSVDRLRGILTAVPGTHYRAAYLSPDDESFYSREVFGDPHLDRFVAHDDGSLVGLLTLAAPPDATHATETDLDSIVKLAWSHRGETTDTVTIAGHPVRRVQKPDLGATVYVWLDRGVYGQLVATDPAAAEAFLGPFIAAQLQQP